MKISVDVDCSPEEARRFLGLPDLTPVHQLYVDKMKAALEEGGGQELMAEMAKAWSPMGEAGLDVWRQMVGSMAGKPPR